MLSKKNRLNRGEIEQLKAEKKGLIQGRFFALIFKKTDLPGKFGLIISNKISLKSTERNRAKRLLYLAIENKLPEKKGLFLFLAKKSCVNGNLEEFEREMENFRSKLVISG